MKTEEEKNIQELGDDDLENISGGAGHTAIRYHCYACGDYYDNPGQCPNHAWVKLEACTIEW